MTLLLNLAVTALVIAPGGSGKQAKEIAFDGLGKHRRTVTTRSPEAQKYFNQGLNFLFAFNHDEAIRAFKETVRLDPNCAMGWWGLATANGPHINNPMVPPERESEAFTALKKARSLRSRLTPAERALIDAASVRFKMPAPKDRSGLDRAYADAMRKVWKSFPRDADAGALFAESMMDLRPWDLWKPNGTPQPGTNEITATLAKVLKVNPDHPLALHLSIHAWEASPWPERSLEAANRLRDLQPGLGHMVHMPSHIDVRLGQWEKAIQANEKAIAADEKYRSKRPSQGFYRIYMMHNRHMLGFAAMMVGQSEKTIKMFDSMVAGMPPAWIKENAPFVDGYVFMPLEARVRFGRWAEVLAWPEYPEYLPLSTALRHMARGVAYAATGKVFEAEAERLLFLEAKKKVSPNVTMGNSTAAMVLAVAEPLLEGEILVAKGDKPGAIAQLRRAVQAEDQLRYDEPPDWILPTRHVLGVVLLSAGLDEEAERVYRADLKRLPNNGWSLNGLAESLRRQGKNKEADAVEDKFALVWKNADMQITSSCMCVPYPNR